MRKIQFALSVCVLALFACQTPKESTPVVKNELRAPAFPLISIDPNTSAWSASDHLYDSQVQHWTGKDFPLMGALRVDGKVYRFMGKEVKPLEVIAPMVYDSQTGEAWSGKYSQKKPNKDWQNPNFKDSNWSEGKAGFGTNDYANVHTPWESKDLWIRRNIELKEDLDGKKVYLRYSHDDIFELYINGIQVVKTGYEWRNDVVVELSEEVVKSLKRGKNLIASHTHNQTGGAYTDFGLYTEAKIENYLNQAAVQKSVDVQATQTSYVFECGEVELTLHFLAPLLLNDLNLISRPVNYLSYEIKSLDGKAHESQIYFEAGANWALDLPSQDNQAEGYKKDDLVFLKTGSTSQKILNASGDDKRIDWGYFYLAAKDQNISTALGNEFELRALFALSGKLKDTFSPKQKGSLALSQDLGNQKSASGKIMIGYDDLYSIQYFKENLRPYWNRNGDRSIEQEFAAADKDYDKLQKACKTFDADLMQKASALGGRKYAELCALAYRQSISAHKLVVSPQGELLFLSKENDSNGCINTVDVTYPSAPLYLLYNPELLKGMLTGILNYSKNGLWTKPFPAHDIGQYPLANGQVYGGDGMPVEEAGNMLSLIAAIGAAEGNAQYAEKYWSTLTIWADYLVEHAGDPENQLCTDDFAGHFAHNVNLSIKGIMGIASYAYLAEMLGKKELAEKYRNTAREMATECTKMSDDGDHYRLTYDKPGTWSQKYNLIWDKVLKMDIFPKEYSQKELAYYLGKQNQYGLPLDSRKNYSKSDWIMWTAALSDDPATFQKFIDPVYDFYNETSTRVPMSDWYNTDSDTRVGFKARSVVGGYFMKLFDAQLNSNKK